VAKISGKSGKVMYGSVVIANIDEWSMTGFAAPVVSAPPAFGDTGTKTYEAVDLAEGGTISFKGTYDPADTAGQLALSTVCQAGTHLTNLYLYANTNTFWRVTAGGEIIITRVDAVTLPRNNYGTISYDAQISGNRMEQVGTGT